jgi:urea transport system permease protein
VIFGIRGVINLAHGEFFILGVYTVVWFQDHGGFWWGLLCAPLVVGAIGWVVERSIVRHLYHRPLDTLVATWGVGIIIRELLKIRFGPGSLNLRLPIQGQVSVLGASYPGYRLVLIGISCAVLAAVAWVFLRTSLGLRVRAVIERRGMAQAMGVNAGRVDQAVFVLGAALAGLAGAVMSPLITVNPEVGLFFLASSFLVVIVGGVGSVLGAIGAAAVIGGSQAAISSVMRPVFAQALLFLLAIAVVRLRAARLLAGREGT